MSSNYSIVTLVPSIGVTFPYITVSNTLTISEVILVASVAIRAVPAVATSTHWLGGLDNAGPASLFMLHCTLTRRTTHPNACYQSLGIGLIRWKQGKMRNHQAYRHNVKFWKTTFYILNWFKDTKHYLFCHASKDVIHFATHFVPYSTYYILLTKMQFLYHESRNWWISEQASGWCGWRWMVLGHNNKRRPHQQPCISQ
jgi:hypothetical protein